MFYHHILSLINSNHILILIPRIVSVLFVFLQGAGMLVYPGGTIHDITSEGYSFTSNFFSDMGAYAARNGEPNYLSMIFFSLSLNLVGITFSFYYFALPKILGNNKINYILSWIGTFFALCGSICLIGTGLTPTDIVFDAHVLFANNIFYSFLITALCYTIVIYRSEILDKLYALGYLIFFISIFMYVGVLQFGPSVNDGQSALVFQVVAQKLIVIVFVFTVLHQTFGFNKIKIDFSK